MRKLLFLLTGCIFLLVLTMSTLAQQVPGAVFNRGVQELQIALGINTQPDNWLWQYIVVDETSLGCNLVQGSPAGSSFGVYVMTYTYPSGDYVVHVAEDAGRVVLCDLKFPQFQATPTAVASPTVSQNPCMALINVETNTYLQPDLNSGFVTIGTLQPSEFLTVTEVTPARDWFQINKNGALGWIPSTTMTASGDCANLPVFGATPVPSPTPVLPSPFEVYLCPRDYAGYLPPRIRVGVATARVGEGGVPNKIRAYPTTDENGTQVGLIQPGRTVDRIVAGPVCNNQIVWWRIEVDGVTGWTAESQVPDYFLEPTAGNEIEPTVPQTTLPTSPLTQVGVVELGYSISQVTFTPDGRSLLIPDQNGANFEVWDVTSGLRTPNIIPINAPIAGFTFSPLGELVTTDMTGSIRYWDLTTFQEIPDKAIVNAYEPTRGGPLAFNGDGSMLLSADCHEQDPQGLGCNTSLIKMFDTRTKLPARLQAIDSNFIDDLQFNADDTIMASLSLDGTYLFDAASGTYIDGLFYNSSGIVFNDLDFGTQPDFLLVGGCLAEIGNTVECLQGVAILYDIQLKEVIQQLEDHANNVTAVEFSNDGKLFATVGDAGSLLVYSFFDGEKFGITGHTGRVTDVAFSPDDRFIVTSGLDGKVIIWNAPVIAFSG